jgi:COP9 signalosome complex subunit 2
MNSHALMVERYRAMLQYVSSVTRNECTEAINTILDTIASATNVQVLSQMYEITLEALKSANNERLWFNTNIKLAKLYLEGEKIIEVERLIRDLKTTCQLADGRDDPDKGSFLLEVYCLEIQLCSLLQDAERMRFIYPKTLNLNAAVADPRIMGIIREEGGKMQMAECCWLEAYNEFYAAFRHFQEAGNHRARDCLKYVVLASMLSLSDINPFAAREAKAFADDPEILGMSELRQSLEASDLPRFERAVRNKRNRILDEPFLMTYLEPLRRRMREQVLINLVRPYQRVTLSFLAQELSLNDTQLESLLVDLIRNGKLTGLIDEPQGWLILTRPNSHTSDVQNELQRWTENLSQLQDQIMQSTFVM